MGRKKRAKVEVTAGDGASEGSSMISNGGGGDPVEGGPSPDDAGSAPITMTQQHLFANPAGTKSSISSKVVVQEEALGVATASSGYAMTSHSGEIVQEDIYVSDGSADSDEEDETEIVLTSSRMGIMRRGLHHQMTALQQPNRQWTRQNATLTESQGTLAEGVTTNMTAEETAEERRKREEDELAQLDPAQRAARLLQDKQRREIEAKIEARHKENEDNVTRDPALFSKRTAFDIRFDQIEEKPWQRGVGTAENFSDFFNYGLSEEDWLEYSEQQLLVRQELIDASRQKRAPDPTIVPIQPRAKEGATIVAVAVPIPQATTAATVSDGLGEDMSSYGIGQSRIGVDTPPATAIGPTTTKPDEAAIVPNKKETEDVPVGVGGAWGAGAAPGSLLARLMEEQEGGEGAVAVTDVHDPTRSSVPSHRDSDNGRHNGNYGDTEDHRAPVKSERDSYYGRSDPEEYAREGDYDNDTYDPRGHWREQQLPPPPEVDHYGGVGRGGGWQPPPLPPPPLQDPYYPPPPAEPEGGYYGVGRGRRGYGGGGRSESYGGRGRGGGRGYYDREGSGDYYQDSQSGWKRPREGGDPRRRR